MSAPRSIAGTDAWGELDDLLIEDVTFIRLERVDRDRWCLVCARGNRRVLVHLEACQSLPKDCRLSVTVIEDELGCDPETGDRMAAALFPAMEPDMRARAVDGSSINTAAFVPGGWRNGVK